MATDEHWKIEILDGPRGTVDSTTRPISWRFNKTANKKEGFTARIPWNSNVSLDSYFYLKHDSSSEFWFYGRIDDISRVYEGREGQIMQLSGYCNLEQLSEVNVEQLEVFQFGYNDPYRMRQIQAINGSNFDNELTVPISWPAYSRNGHTTHITSDIDGIDAIYIGSLTPFKGVEFNITTAMQPLNFDRLKIQYMSGANQWDDALIQDYRNSIFTGTDNTSAFLNTGINSILFDTDPAGEWTKNSQSDENLFWLRIWFQEDTLPHQSSVAAVFSSVKIYNRIPVSDAITKLMTLAPSGWTVSNSSTADDIYHMFNGESMVEAFSKFSRKTGGMFFNASNNSGDVIGWLPSSDSNLSGAAVATFSNANNNISSITGRDVAPSATRLTLYGGGNGQNALTAALEDGTVTIPAGYSYNSTTNVLANLTAEGSGGINRIIHREARFSWVSSLFSSGQSVEASNQILSMGIRLLEKASKIGREAYTVSVKNLSSEINIGDCVQLTYGKGVKSVSSKFIVTSFKGQYSASSPDTTFTVELSSDGYQADSATGQVSLELSDGTDEERYRQVMWAGDVDGVPSAGGVATEEGDDLGNHTATENLDMGGFDITNVDEVDGVDVSDLESTVNSHVGNTSNPHSVTASQIGALSSPVAFNNIEDINQNTITGRIASGAGPMTDLSASQIRTIINVEDNANDYDHPDHTGDVTSSGDGATTLQAVAINGKGQSSPVAGDYFIFHDVSLGQLRKVNADEVINSEVSNTHGNHTGDVTSSGLATTISSGAVTNAKLGNNSVSTAKLQDEAVTLAKLEDMDQYEVVGRTASGSGSPSHLSLTADGNSNTNLPLRTDSSGYARVKRLGAGLSIPEYAIHAKAAGNSVLAFGIDNSSNNLILDAGTDAEGDGFIRTRSSSGASRTQLGGTANGGDLRIFNGAGLSSRIIAQVDSSGNGQISARNSSDVSQFQVETGTSCEVAIKSMPTTEPSTDEVLWNDGGAVVLSDAGVSWTAFAGNSNLTTRGWTSNLEYCSKGGLTWIRGTINRTSGSLSLDQQVFFTMPAGFRPNGGNAGLTITGVDASVLSTGDAAVMLIDESDGEVRLYGAQTNGNIDVWYVMVSYPNT